MGHVPANASVSGLDGGNADQGEARVAADGTGGTIPWSQAMNDTPTATTHKVQLEITWKSVMRLALGVLLAYVAVLL